VRFDEIDLDCSVGRLRLEKARFPPAGGAAHDLLVTVEVAGLVATVGLGSSGDGGQRLTRFFDELAADWRGWSGTKSWASEGVELILDAAHDGRSSVTLHVRISRPWAYTVDDVVDVPGHWRTHTALAMDVGALDRNADRVRSLLGTANDPEAP
jgi:hypothetical protein